MSAVAQVMVSAGYVPEIGQWMAVLNLKPAGDRPALLRHTVLALDCSISMTDDLASMEGHARDFVRDRHRNEYLSVVAFSGHDRACLLAGPVKCDELGQHQLCQAIEQGVAAMDTTVFSEPLELVLNHLRSAQLSGMTNHVVLFTDGCAVPTRWDKATETSKALATAAALYQYGATLSAIGYGPHYDEAFIQQLMEATHQGGIFRHLSDLTDFDFILDDIQNAHYRSVPSEVELEISFNEGEAVGIFQTLPEVAQVDPKNRVATRYLYQGGLTRYVALNVTTMPKRAQVKGSLDGQTIDQDVEIQPLTGEQQASCAQLRAAHLVVSGQTAMAGRLLTELGDERASEQILEAHTPSEQRVLRDRCRSLIRQPNKFFGSGLKPSGPNRCVLNALEVLMSDPTVIWSLPSGFYPRGGLFKVDPRIIESPLGRTLTITGCVSHESRLNFSFRCMKDVRVRPVDADGNILYAAKPESKVVYRTYNVIRDGELVMPQLMASMSEDGFDRLVRAGLIAASTRYQPGQAYTLELRGLRMVSSAWARPNALQLVPLLQEIAELKAKLTALNARVKALGKPEFIGDDPTNRVYYEKLVLPEGVEPEHYEAGCTKLELAEYQPSDYTAEADQLDAITAYRIARQVRHDLETVRFRSRLIVFACELTGWGAVSWSKLRPVKRSRAKQEQQAIMAGQLLKRVVWTEMIPCS